MKIGAAIMIHNMAPFIGAVINSLSWVDGIYLYDDNSTDNSANIAKSFSRTPLIAERSIHTQLAFERGEMETRNYVINQAFHKLTCDILIIIDADELISSALKTEIEKVWKEKIFDSIAFTTWHLYSQKQYLHFWETTINDTYLIDPHTRVIMRGKYFERLFEDGSHPIIHATGKTLCLHGSYHFHLKYYRKSPYPNHTLNFLPERLTYKTVKPYIKELPFALPSDIVRAIQLIDWGNLSPIEIPRCDARKVTRDRRTDPKLALIHPKDKP